MHELSIVYELYRTVTQLAAEAGLHRVEAVRLQVGELSGVSVPAGVLECCGARYAASFYPVGTGAPAGYCHVCALCPLVCSFGLCPHLPPLR